jgi:hypothetical protein
VQDRYANTASDIQRRVDEGGSTSVSLLVRHITDAGFHMLNADLYFREAERCEVLGVHPGRAEAARSAAMRYHEASLSLLAEAIPAALSVVREEMVREDNPTAPEELLADFDQTVRDQIVETDLRATHAKRASELVQRATDAGRSGGVVACDVLAEQITACHELRRRRPEGNAPLYFAVSLVFAVVFVVHMVSCAISGTCGRPGNIALAYLWFGLGLLFGAGGAADL